MSAKRAPFMMLFRRGNRKKSAGARSGGTVDDREWVRHAEPRIAGHGSHSAQARYHASTSTVQSCATLAKHGGCVIATVSKLPRRMRNFTVWPTGMNSLWMILLLSKKAINIILTLDFCRRLFLGCGEDGECHSIDCRLDCRSNW